MKSITLPEAIYQMRQMRNTGKTFRMEFIPYDKRRGSTGVVKVCANAELRHALPSEKYGAAAELYLPYTDKDKEALGMDCNKVCRKRLIRRVAFPPQYEILNVIRFYR